MNRSTILLIHTITKSADEPWQGFSDCGCSQPFPSANFLFHQMRPGKTSFFGTLISERADLPKVWAPTKELSADSTAFLQAEDSDGL
ncbi:8573_t:CDS:2 [Acaulospora morrowiae]|uniref:8573_t:CDS:1 n=1 Tax=Acaulospora morrowiae TaxID=94023 RepID=A0A9N8YRA1_9GLOM|nr:8573_t:CDS:2 [Acaulospora morrowiae]